MEIINQYASSIRICNKIKAYTFTAINTDNKKKKEIRNNLKRMPKIFKSRFNY